MSRAATVKIGNTIRDQDSDGVTNSLSQGRHLHLSVRIVSNISCFKRIEPLLVIRRTMTRLTSPVIIQQVWLVTQYRKIAKKLANICRDLPRHYQVTFLEFQSV